MNKDWKHFFKEINKIPRKSGNEKMISKYVIDFAIERNLKYYTDEFYNVIVWKDASENCKNNEILGLQAHLDMVCEKTKESEHDFTKDPIEMIEENGFIKAKDTTLGADNGIGVAYILSVLDSTEIKHPKIEAIFTTQEETTMDGVSNLDGGKLSSTKIISFDNFSDKEIWIGSASSQEWYTEFNGNVIKKKDLKTYKLLLNNFIGGHAGMNIGDEWKGNPIKIAFDILMGNNVYINSVKGGSLINVIPRDCEVVFGVEDVENNTIKNIKNNINKMKDKYKIGDINLEPVQNQEDVLDEKSSLNIIECINDFEAGAIYRDENQNVLVGANLASIDCIEGNVKIAFCVRGNRRTLTDLFIEKLKKNVIKKHKLDIKKYDEWCGYEQSIDNELIQVCKRLYEEIIKEVPNVLAVQACLECELLGMKIKNLQYVALGTNIYDAHSVKERVEIKSVEKMWNVFLEMLNFYFMF